MDMGAVRPGERVVIIGGGVIGLLAVQLACLAGGEVLLLTRSEGKQTLGEKLGASHVAGTAEDALAIWPEGADLVVECAGVEATVEMCPTLTRSGGRIVVLGVLPNGTKVSIEPFDLLFREIQMHFGFLNPFTQERATQMIAKGSISVAPLISRTLNLESAGEAISEPARPGEVRAIVVP